MWRRYCCLTAFLDPITELRGRFAAENFGEGGKVVEERKGREAKEGKGRAIPPNRNPGYGPVVYTEANAIICTHRMQWTYVTEYTEARITV